MSEVDISILNTDPQSEVLPTLQKIEMIRNKKNEEAMSQLAQMMTQSINALDDKQ